jgi:diguanylate cyclase (GGDEF)-like protein
MSSTFDLRKYLDRSDTIYIVVIVLGLFFLVFLDDLPVRLIGACIALLSGVVLVVTINTRLKERVELRRPAPTQSVELSMKVKKDASGTRYVFDDFESNFGGDDVPDTGAEGDESKEAKESKEPKRIRFDDTSEAKEPTVVTRRESAFKNPNFDRTSSTPRVAPRAEADEDGAKDGAKDFEDEISGMRIKARRPAPATSADTSAAPAQERGSAGADFQGDGDSGMRIVSRRAVGTESAKHAESAESSEHTEADTGATGDKIASTTGPDIADAAAKQAGSTSDSKPDSKSDSRSASANVQAVSESGAAAPQTASDAGAESASDTSSETSATEPISSKRPKHRVVQADLFEDPSLEIPFVPGEPPPDPAPRFSDLIYGDAIPLPAQGTDDLYANTFPAEQNNLQAKATMAAESSKQRQLLLAMANLIDDAEHPSDDEEEPRKEFDYLLSRVLMVIRSMMNARTAAFFWVNKEQNELVLETRITDVEELFRTKRKYTLGLDIVSQIAKSGRPEILTEIKPSAQTDLIPYYNGPAGTTSFVGVPVFLNHTVIGVLCADSTQDDAYDEITIGSLGHFTKLISGLTQSYTGKYDLLQRSRALEALTQFRSMVNRPGTTMQQIASALVDSSASVVESQTIGVVLFDRQHDQWTIHNIMSALPGVEQLSGSPVNTESSLIAPTIFRGVTNCVPTVAQGVLRFHEQEGPLHNGFFVAVPLKSTTHCYGALFAEGNSAELSGRDVAILETIGEQTGILLEQIHVQKMLKKSALVDEASGLLNSGAFIQRLEEELVRATETNVPLVSVLVHIDRYSAVESSLNHGDREELFLHVLSVVRKYVRGYDVVGRVDENIIALAVTGTRDTEVQLWAERLRKEVAISVKEIHKKRYTVTVSIGIAKAIVGDNAESLLTNAGRAMELASAKTNNVVVFA